MIYHINVAFINVPLYAVYSTYTCSIYSIAMIYVLLILPGCFCWQDLAKRIGEAEELQRRWMQVVHDSPGGFFWGFRRGCSHHLQFFSDIFDKDVGIYWYHPLKHIDSYRLSYPHIAICFIHYMIYVLTTLCIWISWMMISWGWSNLYVAFFKR